MASTLTEQYLATRSESVRKRAGAILSEFQRDGLTLTFADEVLFTAWQSIKRHIDSVQEQAVKSADCSGVPLP